MLNNIWAIIQDLLVITFLHLKVGNFARNSPLAQKQRILGLDSMVMPP